MKVKYFINEEKRTITALLELEDTERHEVIHYGYDVGVNFVASKAVIANLILHRTYTGVVTCLPEDTWDVDYGKTIARRKAYGKYLMARAKKMGQITTAIDKLWHQVNKQELEFWNKASEYSAKTDELAGFND